MAAQSRTHLLRVMVALLVIAVFWVAWRVNFFLLPFASIKEDGADGSGYVYANTYRPSRVTHLLVTRQESGQKHSYLASVENDHGGPAVMDCDEWKAPHAPFFIVPDVNPPCIHWYAAEQVPPEPKTPKRNVVIGDQSIEFTANDGKRVAVHW
jgi:hypothetical protein